MVKVKSEVLSLKARCVCPYCGDHIVHLLPSLECRAKCFECLRVYRVRIINNEVIVTKTFLQRGVKYG